MSDLTWAERQFAEQETPRRRFVEQRGVAVAAFAFAAVVFLGAAQHEGNTCGGACLDIGGSASIHGEPWTWYDGVWQWQAQWGLALAGILATFAGMVLGSRFRHRRLAAALTVAGTLLAVAWIVWRVLEPAVPS